MNPLRAHLDITGETAASFADRLGVSDSYLSRLLRGEREADATLLAQIDRLTAGRVSPDAWVAWWAQTQSAA